MEKRIFILGSSQFPRGSAAANYDQYLALALVEAGWDVVLIGKGENREKDNNNGRYTYRGLEYYNNSNSFLFKFGLEISFYRYVKKKFGMSSEDYFVLREIGWLPQFWLAKKIGTKNMVYVHYEELSKSQFKYSLINPQYWNYLLKWNFKLKKIKKAFPISRRLESIEKRYGCKTLRIPIMSDPYEFGFQERKEKPRIVHFIYPGAKLNGCEDDIEKMLTAFSMLSAEEKSRVELHITGSSIEQLEKAIKKRQLIDDVRGVLVVHNWMRYCELTELYKKMDFLILARFTNQLTESNFPSKIPESLSYGIIPVCTRIGDYTLDYLKDGIDSIVFEGRSLNACVEAIRYAVNMTDEIYLMMRDNARKTSIERFYYKKWSAQIDAFLMK